MSPTAAVPELDDDVVLAARDISVDYDGPAVTHAVRSVNLELRRGEVLGIAGESGCGKSTLAYALCQLLRPPARLVQGQVLFRGRDDAAPVDLTTLDQDALRRFRWNKVSLVFQSAMNALNPVSKLTRQFDDIFRAHVPSMRAPERRARSAALLEMVAIDPTRLDSFPHELSGGMRQRVMIAMALALEPEVVVMDEPTTALDVVVQREILDEVERLREELGFSVIFITHDLSLLLEVSDRLAVMYAGKVVEETVSAELQTGAAHPYTQGLLWSFPDLRGARRTLHGIPGSPPDLSRPATGCAFAPRCPHAFEPCRHELPALEPLLESAGPRAPVAPGRHAVSCHLHDVHWAPDGPPSELRRSAASALPTSAKAPSQRTDPGR